MSSEIVRIFEKRRAPCNRTLVEARGHILVMSPKGHCELAGQGIEYDWGKMKQNFRRKNKYKNFHGLIQDSMSTRKFARKARAYRRTPIDRVSMWADRMSMRPLKKNGQVI